MPRQTSIIASAIIPAPPERVWEIACDTSRYPEWVENTLRMIRTDGPARAGATMEELTRIAGPWKSVTRWRVTEFDPPRRQVPALLCRSAAANPPAARSAESARAIQSSMTYIGRSLSVTSEREKDRRTVELTGSG